MRHITGTSLAIAMLLTALLPFAAAAEDEPINLQPRFAEGQASTYEIWSLRQQHIRMEAGGNEREASASMELEGRINWQVQRVHQDGSATCLLTVEWLTMEIVDPDGQSHSIDTRRPTGEPADAHQTFSALSGTPLSVTMRTDGSIASVRGFEPINNAMPEGSRDREEIYFIELATGLASVPGSPEQAAIGTQWNVNNTWSHEVGAMQFDTRHTLSAVEEVAGISVAMVDSTSRLTLLPDTEKLGIPPEANADIRLLAGSTTSQYMVDLSRREIVGRNGTTNTRIQIRVPLNEQITLVQTIEENVQGQALRIHEGE